MTHFITEPGMEFGCILLEKGVHPEVGKPPENLEG